MKILITLLILANGIFGFLGYKFYQEYQLFDSKYSVLFSELQEVKGELDSISSAQKSASDGFGEKINQVTQKIACAEAKAEFLSGHRLQISSGSAFSEKLSKEVLLSNIIDSCSGDVK